MKRLLRQIISAGLVGTFVTMVLLRPAISTAFTATGASSAQRAAQPARVQQTRPLTDGTLRDGWKHAFAFSDTTGYEFPEDEVERTTWSVVREVVLWTALAGFVAFFIIKVFLEGDDPAPTDDGNGKPPPGGTVSGQNLIFLPAP